MIVSETTRRLEQGSCEGCFSESLAPVLCRRLLSLSVRLSVDNFAP